jgi:hypothetical protein
MLRERLAKPLIGRIIREIAHIQSLCHRPLPERWRARNTFECLRHAVAPPRDLPSVGTASTGTAYVGQAPLGSVRAKRCSRGRWAQSTRPGEDRKPSVHFLRPSFLHSFGGHEPRGQGSDHPMESTSLTMGPQAAFSRWGRKRPHTPAGAQTRARSWRVMRPMERIRRRNCPLKAR